MKAFILTILIVGMWGITSGNTYDPVYVMPGIGIVDSNGNTLLWVMEGDTIVIKDFSDSTDLRHCFPDRYLTEEQARRIIEEMKGDPLLTDIVDTCIPFDRMSLIDPPIDTIRICCCTVFVDKPCTVWVEQSDGWKVYFDFLDSIRAEINLRKDSTLPIITWDSLRIYDEAISVDSCDTRPRPNERTW